MSAWWVLLVVPLVAGSVMVAQTVEVAVDARAPLATLAKGDKGTATVNASGTSASVTVDDLAILVADDVLRFSSVDASWQVRVRYVAHTGFTGSTTSLTVSLADGLLAHDQVVIVNGLVKQSVGLPVDLPTLTRSELRAGTTLLATGTVTMDIEMYPDSASSPLLRYRVVLTVT